MKKHYYFLQHTFEEQIKFAKILNYHFLMDLFVLRSYEYFLTVFAKFLSMYDTNFVAMLSKESMCGI